MANDDSLLDQRNSCVIEQPKKKKDREVFAEIRLKNSELFRNALEQ